MPSGKSTVFKNFCYRFNGGYNDIQLESYREIIWQNLRACMRILCDQMEYLKNPAILPFTDLNTLV